MKNEIVHVIATIIQTAEMALRANFKLVTLFQTYSQPILTIALYSTFVFVYTCRAIDYICSVPF